MNVTVFGATGRTGIPLVGQAVARGHDVVAFVRDAAGLPQPLREHDQVRVVEGNAYSGASVSDAVDGSGAVVSVLGQTRSGPDDLLTVAGRHIVDAMESRSVDRYVTLVGAGVREEGESVSFGGLVMGTALRLLAGEVLEDADTHVDDVRASDLCWTVVRAPRLTTGASTGAFRHGTDLRLGLRDSATRANVAEFLLDCVEDALYVRELPKVTDA